MTQQSLFQNVLFISAMKESQRVTINIPAAAPGFPRGYLFCFFREHLLFCSESFHSCSVSRSNFVCTSHANLLRLHSPYNRKI